MNSVKEILEKNNAVLNKSIDSNDISSTPGTASTFYAPVSLTPVLTKVSDRRIPLVNMLLPRAKSGSGPAHVFNKRLRKAADGLNPRDAAYAEGGLPQDVSPGYDQIAIPFVPLGFSNNVSGLAQATGRSFMDLEAEAVESTMRQLMESLEWLIYHGSTSVAGPTTSQTQFAGLDELVTQTVDAGGERLSGVVGKQIIDEAAFKIAAQGGEATHLMTSLRTKQNIDNTYFNSTANGARLVINDGKRDSLTAGELIGQINTSAGTIEVLPDFFINPPNLITLPNGVQSTPSGAITSTAYMININFINFVNLMTDGVEGMALQRLGRRTDKNEFFVKMYTVLEVLATEYCVRITNIDDTLPTA